jgi:hypothetical protein
MVYIRFRSPKVHRTSQQETKNPQSDNLNPTTVVSENQKEDFEVVNNNNSDPQITTEKKRLNALYLDSDSLYKVSNHIDELIQGERQAKSKGQYGLGLHYNAEDDCNFIVVPAWFINSTELVPALILRMAITINCPIITRDDILLNDNVFGVKNNKFLTGLIVSIGDTKKVTLSESKDHYEMGRKVGHAMMYYSELRYREIPAHLIRKRHAWFENQPQLKGGDANPTKVYLDKYLKKIIKDGALYKFTTSFCRYGFKQLRWRGDEAALIPHMVSFSEHIVSYYRVKGFTKKEKEINIKKEGGWRKPERPNRTTVFTASELELIRKMMKPFWKSHTTLQKNWCENLLDKGEAYYKSVHATLAEEYNMRWTILEKFGNASTKRLRTIRKKVNKPNLKKREITIDDLSATLTNMGPFWVEKLSGELSKIFGSEWYTFASEVLKCTDKLESVKGALAELIGAKWELRPSKQFSKWASLFYDIESDKDMRVAIYNRYETLVKESNEIEEKSSTKVDINIVKTPPQVNTAKVIDNKNNSNTNN